MSFTSSQKTFLSAQCVFNWTLFHIEFIFSPKTGSCEGRTKKNQCLVVKVSKFIWWKAEEKVALKAFSPLDHLAQLFPLCLRPLAFLGTSVTSVNEER